MNDIFGEMITSLILSGGLGYINCFILKNLGRLNVDANNKEDKRIFLVLFSIINFLLFATIHRIPYFSDKDILVLALTLCITLFLSFKVFPKIYDLMYKLINKQRNKDGLNNIDGRDIYQIALDKNKIYFMYVYSFDSEIPISYGCLGPNETSDQFGKFFMYPVPDGLEKKNYNEVLSLAESKENVDTSYIYINIEEKIRIIFIQEPGMK